MSHKPNIFFLHGLIISRISFQNYPKILFQLSAFSVRTIKWRKSRLSYQQSWVKWFCIWARWMCNDQLWRWEFYVVLTAECRLIPLSTLCGLHTSLMPGQGVQSCNLQVPPPCCRRWWVCGRLATSAVLITCLRVCWCCQAGAGTVGPIDSLLISPSPSDKPARLIHTWGGEGFILISGFDRSQRERRVQ